MEICAVGGYEEVGKNMTAIKVDDDVIICDMGIHLENYIKLTEDEDLVKVSADDLIRGEAVPNVTSIEKWKGKVKAIVPTHAHLDHIGAIPFLAQYYNAPIICSPFTAEVIKAIIGDAGIKLPNKIKVLNPNSAIKLGKLTIEFVSVTHSTPQTVMIVIHTPEGKIIYANDFKFDNYPVVGTKTNLKRLTELGKHGDVHCLIMDSTYSRDRRKMPSETVAREMLRDVLLGTNSDGKAVVVTTFSSHIARLKSIIDFSHKMNRKVIILGRSMYKYIHAAETVGFINFSDRAELVKFSSKARSRLSKVLREGKDKYVLVVTGHQGEPKSMLAKMIEGMFPFQPGDHVIFASCVIPAKTNIRLRAELEEKLIRRGIRIFKDIHISGHAAREDLRDLIEMVRPRHIIPAHGEIAMTSAVVELGNELGYKQVHVMRDGETIRL